MHTGERALIGAILRDPDAVWPVCVDRFLTQDDFRDAQAGILFGVLVDLQADGQELDAINLVGSTYLRRAFLAAFLAGFLALSASMAACAAASRATGTRNGEQLT